MLALFACYLRLAATFPVGSDGASNALEAWDLLHGNLLLRGWTFTDVAFYTTELPEYAAVELARGLNPDVVRTAAAITYTLLVLAAALLARGRARGAEGWARALIAAGIMIAPQLGNGIHVLLSQPDHVGTQVPLLVTFLLLDRAPRRWYTVAAIWALLVVTTVADKIAITDAAVPIVVVSLFYATAARRPRTLRAESSAEPEPGSHDQHAASAPARQPRIAGQREPGRHDRRGADRSTWRGPGQPDQNGTEKPNQREPGVPAQPAAATVTRRGVRPVGDRVREHSFELSVAVAAVAAVGVAQLILIVITRLGGFTLLPVETRMVTPTGIPWHLSMTLQDTLNLFGAEVRGAPPGPQTVFAWLHLPVIVLVTAAFGVALWRLPGRRDLVSDVLTVGLVVNLAEFVASAIPSTPFDTREMVAVLPFGAVLAGRIIGPWLISSGAWRMTPPHVCPPWPSSSRPSPSQPRSSQPCPSRPRSSRLSFGVVAGLTVACACQLAALGYGATRPPASNPEQALAGWLADHHLTTGLGTYTEDNVTTLDSGGVIRLRTVTWPRSGTAVPRLYQSSVSWYDPRTSYANFVVSGTADRGGDLIPRAEILTLAGPPARAYRFQSFTIMVWNKNLLTLLTAPPSRLPGDIGHP